MVCPLIDMNVPARHFQTNWCEPVYFSTARITQYRKAAPRPISKLISFINSLSPAIAHQIYAPTPGYHLSKGRHSNRFTTGRDRRHCTGRHTRLRRLTSTANRPRHSNRCKTSFRHQQMINQCQPSHPIRAQRSNAQLQSSPTNPPRSHQRAM